MIFRSSSVRWDKSGFGNGDVDVTNGDVMTGADAEWPTVAAEKLGVLGEVFERENDGLPALENDAFGECDAWIRVAFGDCDAWIRVAFGDCDAWIRDAFGDCDAWTRDAVMISVGVDAGVVVLLQLKTSGLDGLCWYPAVKYKKKDI